MANEESSDVKFEIGHVLFLDIVEFSKLNINEQSELVRRLNQLVRDTGQVRLAETDGKLVRLPTGDGMALVFRNSPEAPVRSALEISAALKNHPELRVRMGIHSGPVNEVADVNDRANVAGSGMNMAQRVMDCGDAGHILLSKRVADDLAQYREWQPLLHELGECEVKHGVRVPVVNLYTDKVGNPEIPQKFKKANLSATSEGGRSTSRRILIGATVIAALFLAGLLFAWFHQSGTAKPAVIAQGPAAPASDKSIAVLPFVDLSQAKDQEYFCDGISEEILDALAKIEGLRVVARTSSFSFKGKTADVSEIAQKLGVRNVLEGSLRREGNRIRITAQLVSASNGFHLWSETYERELQGVFAVQDEITRAIVDALKIKLAVAPVAQPQRNTEAYDLYLQGLFLSNKSDEESLRKSLDLFQRARDKDPNFSRAWTGTAKAWLWLADAYVKPLEAYPKVEEAASKALALDERDAEARCYLGEAKRVLHWDLAGEEVELNRALEIDPNSAPVLFTLALLRSSQLRIDESLAAIEKAQKLDPLSPIVSSFASMIYFGTNQLEKAIAAGLRTAELDPNYVYYESGIAGAYRQKGEFEKALAIGERAQQISGIPNPGLAVTYAKMGKVAEAQAILAQMIDLARTRYFAADSIAEVYVALGQKDEAFRWLDRAVLEHSAPVEGISFRPDFRELRSDPRFPAILKRIGLDPEKVLNTTHMP